MPQLPATTPPNHPRRLLKGFIASVTLLLGACAGGSSTDNSANTVADDNAAPAAPTAQPQVDQLSVLGFNWVYTSQLSQCPDIVAYFPSTQLESPDGVLINSWLRTDGNLVNKLTCAPINHSFQRLYIGGVGATEPLDRTEISLLIKAASASHYGISPAQITLSNLSITADKVSWTASVSAFGQTLSETTTLERGEQL